LGNNTMVPEAPKKRPAWTRTLDVIFRTAHVGVSSVLFGGLVCGIPYSQLICWHYLTIATGCTLIASEVYHSYHWPYQGRGIMAFVHLGLLGLIRMRIDLAVPLMTAILVLGMVGSHMPRKLRNWSFIHRRVM